MLDQVDAKIAIGFPYEAYYVPKNWWDVIQNNCVRLGKFMHTFSSEKDYWTKNVALNHEYLASDEQKKEL